MAITPVPTLTDIPSFPALADRAAGTYNSKAYEFGTHMADKFNGEIAAVAANVRNNALEAQQSAQAAEGSAASAATNATNAARDAATAASAPGTNATSTTSMAIGLGTKTFTLAQTGKLFGRSNTITISAPTGDNWMSGPITAFNSATGEMTVNVTNISGSGTFAAWTVSLSGAAGLTGVVNELRAANIASAATTNLTAATGNLVHITGTTTISAFTLASGAERSVIFDSALTLINSSGLSLPSDTNIVTAAGDRALVRGDSNGAVVTHYQRASGLPVAGGVISKEYLSPDQVIVAGGTLTLAHGFGSRPKLIQPYLRCVVEQAVNNVTHQVGDIVPVIVQWNASFGCRIKADASNISVRYASGANGPGIFDIYLNDNWRFFIEAFA
jgi:hypothetical protein